MTRIAVISAGLSVPSSSRLLGDQLAAATVRSLAARGETAEVDVIELRPLAHPLADHLLTGFPSGELAEAIETVRRADALVVVSPVFQASYSGLFKMFFDVLDPDALAGKPVLIAATGGTERHSLALEHAVRPLFSYLRATVVPTAVFAASSDWASEGELVERINRATEELAELVAPRGTLAPVRPLDEPVGEVIPFTRLLAAQRSAAVQQRR